MTELDVQVLGATFRPFGFVIRALASWLALGDRNKQLSHKIET